MSNVVEFTSPTLDGVMQAPGRPDEDPGAGIGTPTLRRRRPIGHAPTPRPHDDHPGLLVATYQPTRTDGGHEHLRSEREHARSGSR
jgi:hypothetical protein